VHHDRRRVVDRDDPLAATHARARRAIVPAHVVGDGEAGLRCDIVVARTAGAPRSAVAEALRAGRVLLNGLPAKASTPVAVGDTIDYELPPGAAPLEARAQAIPLEIAYEDDDIVVVVKAAGMVTHPAHSAREGTLVNALLAHAGELPGEPLRAGLVHRLDRGTSGLILVAKTAPALRTLATAMRKRLIEREYLGLVAGIPAAERGTIEGAIGRDAKQRARFAVRSDGRSAVTHYEVREPLVRASELAFRLETGRTHQIRVHLAAFGHPVIGDPLYGRSDPRVDLDHQALHAWRLRLRHPRTGEPLAFESEPPADYVRARDALRA
jgi:23S rRNA pseudouridine1911/1915/1917 synthase